MRVNRESVKFDPALNETVPGRIAILRGLHASTASCSSGIRCWAAFADACGWPHFPTPHQVAAWAAIFKSGATFTQYNSALRFGCRLSDGDTSWSGCFVTAAARGLRRADEVPAALCAFASSDVEKLTRICDAEGTAVYARKTFKKPQKIVRTCSSTCKQGRLCAAGARTRQPDNSKRAHFSAPALQKPHQNSTKRPPKREKKERKLWREREKSAKFWAPHPSDPHPSGPPFGAPTLRGPTPKQAPTLRGPTPKQAPTLRGPTSGPTSGAPPFQFWAHVFFLSRLPIFIFPKCRFFCPVCHFFGPGCNFLFCPDNRLLILSRFRFFCPVAFFLSQHPSDTHPQPLLFWVVADLQTTTRVTSYTSTLLRNDSARVRSI